MPAIVWWPSVNPSGMAWLTALTLALACTGAVCVLYFRLIAHVGPANTIAVTFLSDGWVVNRSCWG